MGDNRERRLLYLHVPFCEQLCPYCSFHRVAFAESLARLYFSALRKEMGLYKRIGYDFQGVYVGGGTPTILIDELEATLALAQETFSIREISVETNPNHLKARNMDILKKVGVRRLSVGIQSFDDDLLKAVDRYDKYGSGQEIGESMKAALGRFDTLNADMMFNFPSQSPASLERDLEILCDLKVDQITYYPLMISDITQSAVEQKLGRVDGHREADYYRRIVRKLIPAYRFSSAWCFSREQASPTEIIDEYVIDYQDYAGLGSGSIGYLKGTCYANTFSIDEYIARVEKGEIPLMASRTFGLKERIHYEFLMKLFGGRLDLPLLQKKYNENIYRHLWYLVLAYRIAGGLRYWDNQLYLTERGRYYWVIMMREFFTAVNNFRDFCRSQLQ